MEFFFKESPRRHHHSSFPSTATDQPSSHQLPPGPPNDSQESFLRDEWEEMMVDKNNHIHLKHHQSSVCGVNNRGESKGFSQAGQGKYPSFQHQRYRRLRRTLKCQQAFSVQKKQQKVIGGRLKQPVKIMEVQGNKIGTPCAGWSLEIQKQEPNHKTPVCEEEFWRKSLCDSVTNQTWEMGERKTQEDESSKSWAAISRTDHFSRWRRLNRQQAQGRG